MKEDYMQIVVDELAKYGLTTDDLSQKELAEMLAEAEQRANPENLIFEGYFGQPMLLQSIKFRKECESRGIKL